MTPNPIAETFLAFSVKRMQLSESDINRCIEKLTEEQLFHRGAEHENSIANLLLHLEGNLRQWVLHGIGNQPDVRTRDAEFTLEPTATLQRSVPVSTTRLRSAAQSSALSISNGCLSRQILNPQATGAR